VSGAIAIVLFAVGLLAVILIHELAHYVFARKFDFRVLEYFIGFGPKLWSTRRNGIEYGAKAFPLGGYVKIAGMNPFVNDIPPGDERRAYPAKPVWQRAVVIAAGPLSHFVVAAVIFTALLAFVGDRAIAFDVVRVTPKLADGSPSPAAVGGLQSGDRILRAGGVQDPGSEAFSEVLAANVGRPVAFTIQRGDELHDVTMTPTMDCVGGRWAGVAGLTLAPGSSPAQIVSVAQTLPGGSPSPAAASGLQPGDTIARLGERAEPSAEQAAAALEGATGDRLPITVIRGGARVNAVLSPVRGCVGGTETPRLGVVIGPTPLPISAAVVEGARAVGTSVATSVEGIGHVFGPGGLHRISTLLFTEAPREANDPTTVIGIGQQVGDAGGQGDFLYPLWLLGFVTVFIGLVNLLPLPPFDGGHLFVLLVEKVRGRAIDMRRLVPVGAVVLTFLATFVLATMWIDITKPLPTP
jgi:RIP metalloprotease RseP